ncbi:MAG TPA: CoA ester lyase [Ilumatobacter sp.]|nr:CoA ester lyase [Ilumatobacter sp.]
MSGDTTRRLRSVHFVPGGNDRFFEKGLASDADTLVLDLEDSVPRDRKPGARDAVGEWLAGASNARQELMVRVNALDTEWCADDVAAMVAAGARSLMVPKVSGCAELDELERIVNATDHHSPITFFPVATETAAAVFALREIAAHSRVDGVCWGAEDLSAELGAASARDADGRLLDVFAHVRTWCLLGAAAGGVPAIDAVWTDLTDLDGLRREAEAGAAMGFDGKITIHPAQIEIVNDVFTPSTEEVDRARALVAAFEEHAAEGRSSFRFDGVMVDAPHLARARRLLGRAGATDPTAPTHPD